MSGGSQSVVYNGMVSKTLAIKYGVRQGSLLAPLIFITVTRSLPDALGQLSAMYANDSNAWCHGDQAEAVTSLSSASRELAKKSSELELVLNLTKTQFLVAGPSALPPVSTVIQLGSSRVGAAKSLEMLSLHLDHSFSPAPALARLKGSLAHLTGICIRTGPLLLPNVHLSLMRALINGTVGCHSAALVRVRLTESCPVQGGTASQVQVLMNDAARAMIGIRRTDKMRVVDFLDKAGLVSLNRAAFRSSATLAWSSMSSSDHPLHGAMKSFIPDQHTRAAAAGTLLPVPPRMAAISIIVANMVLVWNHLPELHQAVTCHSAKTVISKAIRAIPI